jgi:hypothetical protein
MSENPDPRALPIKIVADGYVTKAQPAPTTKDKK